MSSQQAQLVGSMCEGSRPYNTPLEVVQPIADAVGGFDLDPCASADSDLADENIRETGGLEVEWYGTVWCNHPYGRGEPGKWLKKAIECDAELVVTLSKSDTSTNWFEDYALQADVLCFPHDRIKFVGESNSADFANVFGAFGDVPPELIDHFENLGWTVRP